jgi:serine protease
MRPFVRSSIALVASLILLLGATGFAAAARPVEAGRSTGTSYMGTLGTRGAVHAAGKPARNANLSFRGGSVQRNPGVYISFWGPEWGTGFSTGGYSNTQAKAYNIDFFTNVGGSAWNGVVTQYCMGVASGSTSCSGAAASNKISNLTGQLKGTYADPTAVPASPTQTDIANAAKRLAAQFPSADIANSTFMVYTPTGKSMSGFATSWCAWHSSTTYNGASFAYAYIPYMPDAGGSCGRNWINTSSNAYGNGWFDGFSIVAGHEYSEAETDPFPSGGWIDRQGAENADKCAWSAKSANITLGSDFYAVQPTWSNAISGCPTVS